MSLDSRPSEEGNNVPTFTGKCLTCTYEGDFDFVHMTPLGLVAGLSNGATAARFECPQCGDTFVVEEGI